MAVCIGANGSVRGKNEFEPSSLAAESEPLLGPHLNRFLGPLLGAGLLLQLVTWVSGQVMPCPRPSGSSGGSECMVTELFGLSLPHAHHDR